MADVGPDLLGRKPSPPDLRDYRSANFLGVGATALPSDQDLATYAISELQKTTITYKQWASRKYEDVTVTHWWKALNALNQIAGYPPVPVTDKTWDVSKFQLDQGQTGHCVGFGWAGWSDSEPVKNTYVDSDGHAIYYECKIIEGTPGNEDGAYPRDGAKAMLARKRLTTYASASTIDDILAWLRANGPVVIGTDWTNDMFEPDAQGFVKPTGSYAGGHCYLLYGTKGTTLTFKNSWGNTWGINGSFNMNVADFEVLMQSYGEAWVSVELAL